MAEVSVKITELVTKERTQQVKLNTRLGREEMEPQRNENYALQKMDSS
jgi:hypothetical protein